MKVLVGSFNQVNALVEAFLKTDGLFATLLSSVHTSATLGTALITALRGELKMIKNNIIAPFHIQMDS